MSHRTRELPPLTGIAALIRELRYHEASRQGLAAILIVLFTLSAQPIEWMVWVGAPLIAVGTILRLYASGFILKNDQLATEGPYALVRHPLYTGNILITIGFSIACGRWWAPVLAVAFFWFYYPPAIEYEDRKLRRMFGDEWESWAQRMPALVPTFGNLSQLRSGRWSFAKSVRQNGEPFIALFLILCFLVVVWRID